MSVYLYVSKPISYIVRRARHNQSNRWRKKAVSITLWFHRVCSMLIVCRFPSFSSSSFRLCVSVWMRICKCVSLRSKSRKKPFSRTVFIALFSFAYYCDFYVCRFPSINRSIFSCAPINLYLFPIGFACVCECLCCWFTKYRVEHRFVRSVDFVTVNWNYTHHKMWSRNKIRHNWFVFLFVVRFNFI